MRPIDRLLQLRRGGDRHLDNHDEKESVLFYRVRGKYLGGRLSRPRALTMEETGNMTSAQTRESVRTKVGILVTLGPVKAFLHLWESLYRSI